MNWDHIGANWEQFKNGIKQQWSKLSDGQLEIIAGRRDLLAHEIQKTYGVSKDQAEKELDAWQEQQNETAYLIERAVERNGTPK